MAADTELSEIARAKINLTLHVGPVGEDGYHPLQSLVVFAEIGDELSAKFRPESKELSLDLTGPFANDLVGHENNIIFPGARIVDRSKIGGIAFALTKNLPIASGIGGGSADAAAALRLICAFEGKAPEQYIAKAAALGSDIPVCIGSKTCLMSGLGEQIHELPRRGHLYAVLVNPGIETSTGQVFGVYDKIGRFPDDLAMPGTSNDLLKMSMSGRNDLQSAAISICPTINDVLAIIENQPGCQLARMSGSGATCFGLFAQKSDAEIAAQIIRGENPDWWCVSTVLGDRP